MPCPVAECPRHTIPFGGASNLLKHLRALHGDNPKAVTKREELQVLLALRDAEIPYEYMHHVPFRACGLGSETAHAFVDFIIVKPWGWLLLEIDEGQHRQYDVSCDVRRDADIYASVALGSCDRLRLLRFNPDGFKVGDRPGCASGTDRLERLIALIRELDEDPWPERPFVRLFLYYDVDGPDAELPSVADGWQSDEMRTISVVVK